MRRSNFARRIWKPAVDATVGQPTLFHDLRHTHAALLIELGMHPKVIQERLGHADVRTTLDRYGHLMAGLNESVAEGLNEGFTKAGDARSRKSWFDWDRWRVRNAGVSGVLAVGLNGQFLNPSATLEKQIRD